MNANDDKEVLRALTATIVFFNRSLPLLVTVAKNDTEVLRIALTFAAYIGQKQLELNHVTDPAKLRTAHDELAAIFRNTLDDLPAAKLETLLFGPPEVQAPMDATLQ